MIVELDAEQLDLLGAVAAGRVARHRRRMHETAEHGQDWEATPGDPFRNHRRATARLQRLVRQRLVVLPPGDPAAESWPWRLTELGERIRAEHADAAGRPDCQETPGG